MKSRSRQQTLVLATAIGALAMVAAASAFNQGYQAGKSFKINTEGQPRLGNPNSKVSVVVFADFKCPACALYETQVAPKLQKKYQDKVAFYFINFPFLGEDSHTAARALRCAQKELGENTFKYIHHMFKNQPKEKQALTLPLFQKAYQASGGDNPKTFEACISSTEAEELVKKDLKVAQSAAVRYTPNIFVGTRQVDNSKVKTVKDMVKLMEKSIEEGMKNGQSH